MLRLIKRVRVNIIVVNCIHKSNNGIINKGGHEFMKKRFVNNRRSYKAQEINLLRIILLFAGILTPLITYTWRYLDWSSASNIYMCWVMTALFFILLILSYTSVFVKSHFIFISFLMFTISSMSALYFTAINGFNYDYTLLFFFVVFATTMFIK